MYTDPVVDMLTRVRNALDVERNYVTVPYSQLSAHHRCSETGRLYLGLRSRRRRKFKAINIL